MTSCDITVIGLGINLFALLYNNRQANSREARKEIRAKLDQLDTALSALLDSSKKYYLDMDVPLSIENVKIHETINACERHIGEFSHFKNGISLYSDFYIIFDMVTGGKFESKQHNPGDHNADLCKKISIQKELLIAKAEGWFNKQYR
ncbi:hypothetical protein [Methyloglobulus sp.]|uniref:hypothetical protein n=1 Tax=Methyloglobulus sp. TaxID=2518622 RepID=UPI0032B87C46